MNEIETQVIQAENDLLGSLRSGDLARGVGMHLNAPEYRNIWNGEMKTYSELSTRIATAMEKGLSSIDYQVASREMFILAVCRREKLMVAWVLTSTSFSRSRRPAKAYIGVLHVLAGCCFGL